MGGRHPALTLASRREDIGFRDFLGKRIYGQRVYGRNPPKTADFGGTSIRSIKFVAINRLGGFSEAFGGTDSGMPKNLIFRRYPFGLRPLTMELSATQFHMFLGSLRTA